MLACLLAAGWVRSIDALEYRFICVFDTNYVVASRDHMIEVWTTTPDAIDPDVLGLIPYWSLVLPLTLLSAWLLLSKPRQTKPSTESPA